MEEYLSFETSWKTEADLEMVWGRHENDEHQAGENMIVKSERLVAT